MEAGRALYTGLLRRSITENGRFACAVTSVIVRLSYEKSRSKNVRCEATLAHTFGG